MAPIHCDLIVSWRTQLTSGVFYAALIIAILLLPWLGEDWVVWLILVGLIALEAIITQKRISRTKGQLTLINKNTLYWCQQRWTVTKPPFVLSFGILFSLQSQISDKRKRLWVASDSMSEEQWRSLRYGVLHGDKDSEE